MDGVGFTKQFGGRAGRRQGAKRAFQQLSENNTKQIGVQSKSYLHP